VTVKLKEPETVESLALWVTISEGLAVRNEIAFEGDGRTILTEKVAAKKGRQKFDLPEPVTFKELKLAILCIEPGRDVSGSLGEIEGFDREGNNVLLSPPRTILRSSRADILRQYRATKSADPSRPVFMALTGYFRPFLGKCDDQQRETYPEYVKTTDVGFGIYPIYGWNKPEWIHLVHEGTDLLIQMAKGKPVYA